MSAPLVEPVRVPAKHLPMLRYYLRAIARHARDDEPWDTEDDLTGELVISVEHEAVPEGGRPQDSQPAMSGAGQPDVSSSGESDAVPPRATPAPRGKKA